MLPLGSKKLIIISTLLPFFDIIFVALRFKARNIYELNDWVTLAAILSILGAAEASVFAAVGGGMGAGREKLVGMEGVLGVFAEVCFWYLIPS